MAIRVCHIAATTDGATWMLEQLRDLRDTKGYDVSAIIAAGSGKLATRLEAENIPYHTFDFEFPSGKGWKSLLDRVILLAKLLRRERFDIVQTHLFASMILARLASWLADVPVRLAMIAGPYHLEAYTPRWIDGGTCWMDTGLIPSCEYTRKLYRELGVPDHRLSVIYYGPDETKFDRERVHPADLRKDLGLPSTTTLVGMIAYFYPRLPVSRWTPIILHDRANKRQEDLIAAIPAVLKEIPEARFLFVGSGWGEAGEKELESAKALAIELNVDDAAIFTGYRDDVNEVLAGLGVAVQASLSENLGGTIESLLMECPTVATRSGGLVDTVRDGETGIVVSPDDPADLARGVVRILRNPVEAKRMASNGRKLMQSEFTLRRTVEKLDSLYRRQLKSHPRGYRLHRTVLRAIIAGPVFAYLATRLMIDTKFLSRWDARWRPFPISHVRAVQARLMRLFADLRTSYKAAPAHTIASTEKVGNHLRKPSARLLEISAGLLRAIKCAMRNVGLWSVGLPPRFVHWLHRRLMQFWT